MKISKAVITAASPSQRSLPLQTLVDRDGEQKSVLRIIIDEALQAGVEDICVVVCPGDAESYRDVAGQHASRLHFVSQTEASGYGHAIFSAREWVGDQPFLHMVGDHIYISGDDAGCAWQLVQQASEQECAISGVQPTRESQLPYFGAVGAHRVGGSKGLYRVDRVLEKPTPTEAEQKLLVAGLRTGHYLCFFGMHVLTPGVMEILERRIISEGERGVTLSAVLDELAQREQYLALEARGRRYPVDARYGLLSAQLALALSGCDREEVLTNLCELLAQREIATEREAGTGTR